jgi:type I restriction enzyme M protein
MSSVSPTSADQQFLDDLDKKLWNAADRLRSNLDAAVYKHAVLGLIFLKYVSDAFDLRREELEASFRDPKSDYFLDRADYKTDAAYAKAIHDELEDRDYFTEKNVFWVPPLARWKTIRENAALAPDTEIEIRNGKVEKYTFRSAARLIDDSLEAVEKENPRLKGFIEKNRYMQLQLEPAKLVGLISEVVSSIPFRHASLNAKDILGHVYEYFLGQFALAEGKQGGQFYTPKSIVSVIVAMLEPYSGKVYDPAMGSGGFFVQSERYIEEHGGKLGAISVYGQESNPTTWRLTGYDTATLQRQLAAQTDFETFFAQAPAMNPKRLLIKGVICGVRIEEIDDPLMKEIRYLDKLVDDLAKGRPLEKILPEQ